MKNIAETECICSCTGYSSYSDLYPSEVGSLNLRNLSL